MTEPDVRKGMPAVKLDRAEFEKRYRSRFIDPAFKPLEKEIDAIIGAVARHPSRARQARDLPTPTTCSKLARAAGQRTRLTAQVSALLWSEADVRP